MSYVFLIDLGRLDDTQFSALRDLNCTIEINSSHLDDEQYIRLQWLLKFKAELNLSKPRSFNEKIQWLKLYDRRKIMVNLADKIVVRDYVADRVGSSYLKKLYAIAGQPQDLFLDALPSSFVIKCTHGSAWNLLVPDKEKCDWPSATAKLSSWLGINYYDLRREWVYRDIPPRLMAEEYLFANGPWGLLDYKVFCFHGRAEFIQVDLDRQGDHRRNFYDRSWNRLHFELRYPKADFDVSRPHRLAELLNVAETLAEGFMFVRVDLFELDRIFFGEMTFFPGNGFETFSPLGFDDRIGEFLTIPEKS